MKKAEKRMNLREFITQNDSFAMVMDVNFLVYRKKYEKKAKEEKIAVAFNELKQNVFFILL